MPVYESCKCGLFCAHAPCAWLQCSIMAPSVGHGRPGFEINVLTRSLTHLHGDQHCSWDTTEHWDISIPQMCYHGNRETQRLRNQLQQHFSGLALLAGNVNVNGYFNRALEVFWFVQSNIDTSLVLRKGVHSRNIILSTDWLMLCDIETQFSSPWLLATDHYNV